MDIIELLKLRGLNTEARIKLVRHQDKRYDIGELYSKGFLDVYQSYQAKAVFECDFIVSFLGWENSKARFINVYRVGQRRPAKEVPLPPDFPYPEMSEGGVHYELEVVEGFEDLKDRIIVNWGSAALAWHQWLSGKEVFEVLPTGFVKDFPGYFDFVLTYSELVRIFKIPDAHREWKRMLSVVAGIYLIVDASTGLQYVGSAYGETGIYGRWAIYAARPNGGNVKLTQLLDKRPEYSENFRFTILETLPISMRKEDVIERESRYKKKLGSRAFGLNSN